MKDFFSTSYYESLDNSKEIENLNKYFEEISFRKPIYNSVSVSEINMFRLWERSVIEFQQYTDYYGTLLKSSRLGPGGIFYIDENGYASTKLFIKVVN